ncbi:MAG: ATP-binding protein [Bacteroidales bacterium]|jgi:MinD superfamily P-loop ATPase|nr:ATP-binding protein [Bacteroidales bacterium]MDI9592807.1 ATP-binding protein [Bacteroidota bacterium]OQC36460.1 MAG: Hydrogenase-4 component A [Bacteroidetes bacterium ADurb.Bin041]MBP7874905.1 ATP-binding protein [Bacteroidales bacterium]MCO6467227.1 ATP-binding protein [Bacteroidales bacterium]
MELAIISGKGGTGKSSISAAFTSMQQPVMLADCDVDAANMFILFNPTHEEEQVYIGGEKAVIDYDRCNNCGLCISYCRFDAIKCVNNIVHILEEVCDGCKLCSRICPFEAISIVQNDKSRMYSGSFRYGKMVYGRLAPGEENSGKLVNIVRAKAREIAKKHNIENIIIDGPPGIGCAVVSTITGTDHTLIVTEPSASALHDLKRTIDICNKFNLKIWVTINKADINPDMTEHIIQYCKENNIAIAGLIPFDKSVVEAMVQCKTIMEYRPESLAAKAIITIYNNILG